MAIPLGDTTTVPSVFSDLGGMVPTNKVPVFSGDTGGAVPAALSGDISNGKFLRADGSWAKPAGSGTVTSVAMTGDGVIFNSSITGSPIASSGTLIPALLAQTKNTHLAGPTSGVNATPTFRALVGADLPLPAVATLGGVFSKAVVASNFLTGISSVDGSVSAAQPAFTDISGTATSAQIPIAAAASRGGVFSKAAVSQQFLTSISSVDGSIGQAQPAFSDLSGAATAAQLPVAAAAAIGGVFSKAAVSHQFLTSISSVDGSVGQAQPAFSDLSGAVSNAQLPVGLSNFNTATQSVVTVSGTAVYITSSNINLPASPIVGMVVGTTFVWRVAMTKTAAGTGTFQIIIFRGTNGTTGDTADVTQTIGTQTAAVDDMVVDVKVTVTATGATGSYVWSIVPVNKAITATGFGVATGTGAFFSGTVSSVALNTASLKFGLGFKATTGTPTVAIPFVSAEAFNFV